MTRPCGMWRLFRFPRQIGMLKKMLCWRRAAGNLPAATGMYRGNGPPEQSKIINLIFHTSTDLTNFARIVRKCN